VCTIQTTPRSVHPLSQGSRAPPEPEVVGDVASVEGDGDGGRREAADDDAAKDGRGLRGGLDDGLGGSLVA